MDEQTYPQFPVDAPTNIGFPPELCHRLHEALTEASQAGRALLDSEDYAKWHPQTHKASLKNSRRDTIAAWNAEMAAAKAAAEPAS